MVDMIKLHPHQKTFTYHYQPTFTVPSADHSSPPIMQVDTSAIHTYPHGTHPKPQALMQIFKSAILASNMLPELQVGFVEICWLAGLLGYLKWG